LVTQRSGLFAKTMTAPVLGLIFKPTTGILVAMSAIPLVDLPGRPCPIAAALELVGERWALLVVRELTLGNTRFEDIVRGTGAPRDRVTARLKALGQSGVIQRIPYQTTPPRFDYQLTDSGYALLPVLDALLAWGLKHAIRPDDPYRDHYRWAKSTQRAGRAP
jgi:DNA-binding HxlR family transcriptional regulator